MTAILDEWEIQGHTDRRWLAYIFATVYHETYNFIAGVREMYPMKELGGEKYLKSKAYYPYYGRDFCHTSWLENYRKVKDFTGIDVVKHPEKIAEPKLAAKVLIHFMVQGLYTGKKLGDYIYHKRCDFYNARRIINGIDKATLIEGYADRFLKSLNGSRN